MRLRRYSNETYKSIRSPGSSRPDTELMTSTGIVIARLPCPRRFENGWFSVSMVCVGKMGSPARSAIRSTLLSNSLKRPGERLVLDTAEEGYWRTDTCSDLSLGPAGSKKSESRREGKR